MATKLQSCNFDSIRVLFSPRHFLILRKSLVRHRHKRQKYKKVSKKNMQIVRKIESRLGGFSKLKKLQNTILAGNLKFAITGCYSGAQRFLQEEASILAHLYPWHISICPTCTCVKWAPLKNRQSSFLIVFQKPDFPDFLAGFSPFLLVFHKRGKPKPKLSYQFLKTQEFFSFKTFKIILPNRFKIWLFRNMSIHN